MLAEHPSKLVSCDLHKLSTSIARGYQQLCGSQNMRLQGFNRLCASQNCLSEHNTPSSRSKLVCPTSTGYQQLSWQSKLSYQTSIVLQQAFLNLHKQLALNLFSPGLLNLYNPSTGNEVVKIVLLNFYRQSKLAWLQVFNRHCGSK